MQCRDSNPQPFKHESSPITTRPGLPPNYSLSHVPLLFLPTGIRGFYSIVPRQANRKRSEFKALTPPPPPPKINKNLTSPWQQQHKKRLLILIDILFLSFHTCHFSKKRRKAMRRDLQIYLCMTSSDIATMERACCYCWVTSAKECVRCCC